MHTPMRCTHNKLFFWSTSNVCLLPKFPRKSHPHTTSPRPLPSFRPYVVSPVSSMSPGSSLPCLALPCLHCCCICTHHRIIVIIAKLQIISSAGANKEDTTQSQTQIQLVNLYGLFYALKSLVDPPLFPSPLSFLY